MFISIISIDAYYNATNQLQITSKEKKNNKILKKYFEKNMTKMVIVICVAYITCIVAV